MSDALQASRRGSRRGLTRGIAAGLAALLAGGGLTMLAAPPALADTAPSDTSLPETVSADPLPTVQIDGVVWKQLIVGNTVYVGGEFKNARPSGAAAGTNLTPRSNLLAYNLTTGALITSFNPSVNAQVKDLAVSPDGTKLYIAGSFTSVGTQTRYRAAQFDIPSGNLTAWRPAPNTVVESIAATNDKVFLGGNFSMMGSVAREKVAAVSATPAATLLPLSANVAGGRIQDMVVSPDGSQLVIGGSFTSVNGSNAPGYGLARLDVATSASLSLPVNNEIRNGGAEAAVLALETDGTSFYGSGYHFGGAGNMEGSFAADWATGSVRWIEDCHGDTYGVYPVGNVVYSASHKHYCGNSGGFPQTDPWSYQHSTATTNDVRGTNTRDIYGYADHPGTPRPQFLDWYPTWVTGSYTGINQAAWTVTGNSDYVLYGGEFPRVGGVAQQGLVRFAKKALAPNKVGPRLTSAKFDLRALSLAGGTVRLTWPGNPDPDNATITYKLYRSSTASPAIFEKTVTASFWKLPTNGFVDTGLPAGSSQRYRVVASDPLGNQAMSDWVTVTVGSGAALTPYATGVLNDGPAHYWRLGEGSGTTSYDWGGLSDLTRGSATGWAADGAINADTNGASTFAGNSDGIASTRVAESGPTTFTVEAWFKSNSNSGGKIVGFGSSATGNSSSYDRHIYMSNAGRLTFGVYTGATQVITTPKSYNDNTWHHVVGQLSESGMAFYVDGKRIARRTDVTQAQGFSGYWRVGGDSLGSWPSAPSSNYLNGTIDDVAVYPTALSPQTIEQHYTASGRTIARAPAPADAYGKAVYDASPELYWRFKEASGSVIADSGPWGVNGNVSGSTTLNQAGPLAGNVSRSVQFSKGLLGVVPNNGVVSSAQTFAGPNTYSVEAWFKTTSTTGGKVIGFGDAATGSSNNYDRHIYLQDDGRIVFGAYNGVTNTLTSAAAYNNGAWHHVVGTQGPAGMALYVDGVAQGTNSVTQAQNYSGYWRVGGDVTWGSSTNHLDGNIGEVAVYSDALDAATVQQHYAIGTTGQPANNAPTAQFSAVTDKLAATFDAGSSSDSDGTISSYAWQFGDGETGTGVAPSHTYADGGSYTVTLTVTDNQGGTGTKTGSVMVTANQAPTAAYTASMSKLAGSFNAGSSSDSDGTISSYAWDFGDGETGTGATTSHTYAAAGDYQVKLTVTDNNGVTATETKTVTATANAAPTAAITLTPSGLSVTASAAGSGDSDGTISSYKWTMGDGTTLTGASVNHTYAAGATYTVSLTVTDNDGATGSSTKDVTVTAPVDPDPGTTPIASDLFARSLGIGWGNAVNGGAWTSTGTASRFSVAGGQGRHTLASGHTTESRLATVSARDVDITATVGLDKIPDANYVFLSIGARLNGTTGGYTGRLRVNADGTVGAHITVNGTPVVGANAVPGLTLAAGERMNVRFQTQGASATAVRLKVWKVGTTEPTAWTYTRNDSSAGNQVAGAVGLKSYVGTVGNSPLVVSWDDYSVVSLP